MADIEVKCPVCDKTFKVPEGRTVVHESDDKHKLTMDDGRV